MTLLQGIRPHLTSNCSRGNELLDTGQLNVPRNIVPPPPPEHDPYNPAACPSTLCTRTLGTATTVPSPSETFPHADTCRTLSMCRSKHNYSAESDGIVAWHLHASPPGPAIATPCDEGPQVVTAGGAMTTPEAKLTTQAHRRR